jgi:hypothetical protein
METAGASFPGSDHRPRGWFDRRTFWPAVVIVMLVVAVVAIPAWLNHAVAESTSTVSQGDTATLKVEDGNRVTVEPIPGWERVDSPPDQLQLRNHKANVSVSVAKSADDLDRYYQRLARSMRTSGAQALPGKSTTTDTGFTGLTGTLVKDGLTGELSVLAKGEAMMIVESLLPPDQAEKLEPQVTAMVNSVREQ